MKIEKINDNQIRCTLGKADLAKRQLKISELTYGSKKAKELFRDMMHQASVEFGFESENIPLMIEAIPVSGDSIELLITRVENPDELDTRFSKIAPEFEDIEELPEASGSALESELVQLFNRFRELAGNDTAGKSPDEVMKSAAAKLDEEEYEVRMVVYSFNSLKDIIRAAYAIEDNAALKNSLYIDNSGKYYLLIDNARVSRNAAHTFFVLREYGVGENYTEYGKDYLNEHCRLIIKDNALSALARM